MEEGTIITNVLYVSWIVNFALLNISVTVYAFKALKKYFKKVRDKKRMKKLESERMKSSFSKDILASSKFETINEADENNEEDEKVKVKND